VKRLLRDPRALTTIDHNGPPGMTALGLVSSSK